MESLGDLLDQIKRQRQLETDTQLAAALGVKKQTVSNWRGNKNLPDAVACATIAGLTGEPLARVLGIVGEARAISREEKAVWRKLAATAALAVLCVLPAQQSTAATTTYTQATSADYILCYAMGGDPGCRGLPCRRPSVDVVAPLTLSRPLTMARPDTSGSPIKGLSENARGYLLSVRAGATP